MPPIRFAFRVAVLAILLATAAATRLVAQDTTATRNLRPTPDGQRVMLTLSDGSVLIGRVLEVTPSTVRFASAAGESSIPRAAIRSVRATAVGGSHNGEYWPEDPSRTRLFFAPTGRMLRRGEGYLSDAYVFFPSVQGGLSDRLTIGAGMSVIPFLGLDEQVFFLTPKVGIVASPNVNVAVGALVAGVGRLSDAGPFGIGYGVATFGGEDANVTAGAGFGFNRASTTETVLMLGGSRRVSRNVALLSENYLFTGGGAYPLGSAGVRFMSDKIAVDLAGFLTKDVQFPIPYVAFIYKF
jgi:hypothetical protein